MTIHSESGDLCDATSLCEKVLDIVRRGIVVGGRAEDGLCGSV